MTVRALLRLARDRRGATAIEYGLIVGLIVIVMFAAFVNVAGSTIRMWNTVSDAVERTKPNG